MSKNQIIHALAIKAACESSNPILRDVAQRALRATPTTARRIEHRSAAPAQAQAAPAKSLDQLIGELNAIADSPVQITRWFDLNYRAIKAAQRDAFCRANGGRHKNEFRYANRRNK